MSKQTPSYEALFSELQPESESKFDLLVGKRLPGYNDRHLAKDKFGNPLFLFFTSKKRVLPPVRLEHLKVAHSVKCKISEPDEGVHEGNFSVIQCTSSNTSLIEYFLRVMESVVHLIPSPATTEEISEVVDRLATLFLALKRPSTKPIQGLWAELLIIVTSKNPISLLEAWHEESGERYDFSYGACKIEVKSSGLRKRSHYFAHAQVYPPEELSVIVASLFTENCTGGTSLGELWDKARRLAGNNAELRFKVDQLCMELLGSDWEEARERCFDYDIAMSSLKFYDIMNIPKIPRELPEGVSDVRFVADLSQTLPVNPVEYDHYLLKSYLH